MVGGVSLAIILVAGILVGLATWLMMRTMTKDLHPPPFIYKLKKYME